MDFEENDRLCGCTLISKCGEGAYGEVWLAEDAIGTRVALKIVRNGGRCSERELRGLRNYRDCNHPNLLKIRHVEITEALICCTMDAADDLNRGEGEYLPDTLANRLNRFGRLDGDEILAMLDGLLAGLEELHKNGLVHRDIKPDNILWVNGRPTLADAGLIAPDGRGSLAGSPGFLSPRLLAGEGAPQASDDFYALGKVIYCALTGLAVSEYPGLPADMTISVNAGLNRALCESCSRPVDSAAEFRELLAESGCAIPSFAASRSRRKIGRRALSVVLLFCILCAGGVYFSLRRKAPPSAVVVRPDRTSFKLDSREAAEVRLALKEAQEKSDAAQKKLHEMLRKAAEETYALSREGTRERLQKQAVSRFRQQGFLPGSGELTDRLLDYRIMTDKERDDLLWLHVENGQWKNPSNLQSELWKIVSFGWGELDPQTVRARQAFWRQQRTSPGETAAGLQRKMLETDPVMQSAALDAQMRKMIDSILRQGRVSDREKEELKTLVQLRNELVFSIVRP